ncbi:MULTISPECIES: acetyl-CoA carboxylase carboxyltransferase subunit alpha [Psychrilyobacter]|uniref:Acetyl-coenzyme A carboxylase carboxyl transferase subunit alpha n=1 Tax=Psychrilyobacter piezotolerans TaxID=2293438 RepID=A0ABX9KGE1_9FUSO|nr:MULTISPECIES: acetyl-CoA carboxylase carboxyltransferase subunit alpha [Psychrilyobacter]MCS5421514.1 acetyl-CoA carboxylase carboxyltransferase subunit alpha [Psychrilyobacter sp. S5]NDI77741.1 acetyl-CoA carboxylase carboxyltransferase subunit alpha [Psychrilyobacter piezotolerans]RDE61439.1 acetyl-CoA carboxylase carboxyltransferase subunit alpha [Psychrilyobacter sp. S5]REI40960.1 acetyl-CoA carboxylase carboxyltransferase subunit alpha [Psychrilyobacter piezotolerans]
MEFEKKLKELEIKIVELENFSKEKEIDLSAEIEKLKAEKEMMLVETYKNLSSWERVSVARHPKRPYTLDYIEHIVEDFEELHGDRLFKDDPAIVGGIGKIDGKRFVIIGHQKGRDMESNIYRNFGMANPEGYRKALRLMKLAERFKLPVLTLIDTAGAYPGIDAEKHGQGEAIARNLMEMAGLSTQIIAVVIGEGGSGGALALGVADRVFMLENSVYSVISPEGCAAILYKDASRASQAANDLKISAKQLIQLGVIDDIIEEPLGGAHRDHEVMAKNLKTKVLEAYAEIKDLPMMELKDHRYEKFRKMGEVNQGV